MLASRSGGWYHRALSPIALNAFTAQSIAPNNHRGATTETILLCRRWAPRERPFCAARVITRSGRHDRHLWISHKRRLVDNVLRKPRTGILSLRAKTKNLAAVKELLGRANVAATGERRERAVSRADAGESVRSIQNRSAGRMGLFAVRRSEL
jgi:hypothetical protein